MALSYLDDVIKLQSFDNCGYATQANSGRLESVRDRRTRSPNLSGSRGGRIVGLECEAFGIRSDSLEDAVSSRGFEMLVEVVVFAFLVVPDFFE
jgi:hypothetical protein